MEHFSNDENVQFDSFLTAPEKRLQNKLYMQMALAKSHNKSLNDFAMSEQAKIFGEYVNSHPEILDKFDKNREEALQEAEQALYH
ncbi:MAG: hypothetical protein JWN37_111 [Candidatus Nomurabacteria bacterium]|nr:hypothetical protein [Candidatus Nomurabacteria bacterium]